MKTIKKPNKDRTRSRASLLRLAVEIASHPALAGYTPTGPAALATGQGGRIRRDADRSAGARSARVQSGYAQFTGPAGDFGCPGST